MSSTRGSSRSAQRGGEPELRRYALAPGLLAAIVLLAGSALIESEWFTAIRYTVAILALICLVFAVRAKHWWWAPVYAAIAVLWNPVVVIDVPQPWWSGAQFLAAAAFVVAGVLIRERVEPQR